VENREIQVPQWVESFENHPVHKQLQEFETALANLDELSLEEPLPEVTESKERLKQIGNHTGKILGTLDPFLTPRGVLDNINSYLSQATSYCNQYHSDENPTHLENANNQAEAVLVQLGSLLPMQTHEELEGLGESISSFRRSVGQYQRYVTGEHQGIQARIENAKQELAGLSNNISAQQSRVDEVVNELQRQFSESEERRRVEFADSIKDYDARFKEAQEDQAKEFRTFVESRSAQTQKHLEEILQHKQRAEELVYVIANTGMVGGYQKIANVERRAGIIWQITAVVAFLGLIGFAIIAFTTSLGGDVSWQAFGTRLFVVAAFGILAAYAARQADRHAAAERSNRRLELALASVDPYLVSLPEETQHHVKQELAMKFFGEASGTDQKVEEVTGTSADLLRMALETISDLARKTPGSS
jgi:hypothetical protein